MPWFYKCVFQNCNCTVFFSTREFPFGPSAYQKETEAPGFQVESLVHGHEILGLHNYDARILGINVSMKLIGACWISRRRRGKVKHPHTNVDLCTCTYFHVNSEYSGPISAVSLAWYIWCLKHKKDGRKKITPLQCNTSSKMKEKHSHVHIKEYDVL